MNFKVNIFFFDGVCSRLNAKMCVSVRVNSQMRAPTTLCYVKGVCTLMLFK